MTAHRPNENQEQTIKHSDFSIDHILNRAGDSYINKSGTTVTCENTPSDMVNFQWLQCSRYCPPRIPRIHRKDVQKRQLGRHPRIPFSSHQLAVLEQKFRQTPYLSSEEVIVMSRKLQLADIRVKIWFQNRRARERREKHALAGDNKAKDDRKLGRTDVCCVDSGLYAVSNVNRPNVLPIAPEGQLICDLKSEIDGSPIDFSVTSSHLGQINFPSPICSTTGVHICLPSDISFTNNKEFR